MTTSDDTGVADTTTDDGVAGCGSPTQPVSTPETIAEQITEETFDRWYREREFAQNIREGTPYFNGPNSIQSPEKHSPSRLLQCHRKTFYKQLNAPEESRDPRGIFWIGSRFEEDIALPFLREAVTGSSEYVTNSQWVDVTVETDVGELQIRGETDPVIVDDDAKPLLLTEIKTKRSVDGVESPNAHHRAQAHAYMKGLTEKYDREVKNAIILYGGRTNLAIQPFHIEFDQAFWEETVVSWAKTHTSYRLDEQLPPADPEYDWECEFCSYRERCGKGQVDYEDLGSIGVLPTYSDYPRAKLAEYFAAHPDALLPPPLADDFPELADEYGVYDWQCRACGNTIAWEETDSSNGWSRPTCPTCRSRSIPGQVNAPEPDRQRQLLIQEGSDDA